MPAKGIGNAAAPWMSLGAVSGVGTGISTPVFRRSGKKAREGVYWSILGSERTLDLEADTPAERDVWASSMG